MSGLRRCEPSLVTGPHALKRAIESSIAVAPIVKAAAAIAGALASVEQDAPRFPAAKVIATPAARTASTMSFRIVGSVQPSVEGHVQELLMTSAQIGRASCRERGEVWRGG